MAPASVAADRRAAPFTQKPKGELADFQNWTGMLTPRQGDDYFRHNGAGEMLV
jgi:hypothetical protein